MLKVLGAVAAGAAGVDQRSRWGSAGVTWARIARAQPAISSGVSPFIRSADQEAAIWAGLASPRHDLHHGRVGLLGREVVALDQLLDGVGDHRRLSVMARKFSIRVRPCGVSTDSGWNCTPCVWCCAVAHAHDLAVGGVGRDDQHSGIGSSAASEW